MDAQFVIAAISLGSLTLANLVFVVFQYGRLSERVGQVANLMVGVIAKVDDLAQRVAKLEGLAQGREDRRVNRMLERAITRRSVTGDEDEDDEGAGSGT